jgi:hypothetical protein
MTLRDAVLWCATAFVVAVSPAEAGTERPVYVVVVGQGAIRLRLAAGQVAPCDSPDNRVLFDGWVGVGTFSWVTSSDLVCIQHTSGALRESDWSVSQLVATATRKGPAKIVVSTD